MVRGKRLRCKNSRARIARIFKRDASRFRRAKERREISRAMREGDWYNVIVPTKKLNSIYYF